MRRSHLGAGYSLALSVGTSMQTSFGQGVWQPAYFIFGGVGIAVAALLLGTVQTRSVVDRPRAQSASVAHAPRTAVLSVRELVRYWFSSPTLILLCIAGGVRNAGGYVWAYYTALFFKDFRHVPENVFAGYMGLIPLIGGSLVCAVHHVVRCQRGDALLTCTALGWWFAYRVPWPVASSLTSCHRTRPPTGRSWGRVPAFWSSSAATCWLRPSASAH